MNRKILNKDALVFNANFFKGYAPKVCAVVKANAYGHGIKEVALTLKGRVDMFAVSSLEEAEELYKILPDEKILILSKCPNFDMIDRFYLTLTSISDVKKAIKAGKTERCYIKLCTGMNRFGIDANNENLLKTLKNLIKNRVFAGFSAHFSSTSNKKTTNNEYQNFLRARSFLEKPFPICFGGSGAKNLPCDILRAGLGIYGYGDGRLQKVMRLEGKVLQLRSLEKGEFAGYDHTFKAKRRTTLAIVSVGYADGFSREKSKNMKVTICGKKYSIVGNLCMDACFVDVTGGTVKVGDRVLLFDDADATSKQYNMCTYEVLTNFNSFRGETKLLASNNFDETRILYE